MSFSLHIKKMNYIKNILECRFKLQVEQAAVFSQAKRSSPRPSAACSGLLYVSLNMFHLSSEKLLVHITPTLGSLASLANSSLGKKAWGSLHIQSSESLHHLIF